MLSSRICLVFLLLAFFILVPSQASLAKIAAGAPVFIGEQNLDISSGLNGHSVIGWWPAGADLTTPPALTVTVTDNSRSFFVDPAIFNGHTGTWYSHDAKPDIPVFVVYQPQINLSVWNADTNSDITGQSVPFDTNITYRIDTNLYLAYNYTYRPKFNPTDGFFSVTMTSPTGANLPTFMTGNSGNPNTQILPFDSDPIIQSSPYYWSTGPQWYHQAKGPDGNPIYPAGTYTFVASQNLNGMSSSYNGSAAIGTVTTGPQTVTFQPLVYSTPTTVLPSLTAPPQTSAPVITPSLVTTAPTATVVPKKTTYSPLPEYLTLAGLGIAGMVAVLRRKY